MMRKIAPAAAHREQHDRMFAVFYRLHGYAAT
jgi:hypothetical protein